MTQCMNEYQAPPCSFLSYHRNSIARLSSRVKSQEDLDTLQDTASFICKVPGRDAGTGAPVPVPLPLGLALSFSGPQFPRVYRGVVTLVLLSHRNPVKLNDETQTTCCINSGQD